MLTDSMFDSKWVYKSEQRMSSDVISEIIAMRGISEKDRFLNPNIDDLIDPFLMNDMDRAVTRINCAVDNKEKICIYGDYDADGLTSASILIRFFRGLGLEPGYFIPDRFDDGYGLSTESLEKLVQDGYSLVITTDCGINSVMEAEFLKKCNVDLIITDHHKSLSEIPLAEAVICCTRKDNTYPYHNLSGAGVAYKISEAVRISRNISEIDKNLLLLAAIGTVTDIVLLDGENRIIVKEGLKLIKAGINIGIEAILEYASVKPYNADSMTLGFVIGPRINAAGRMGEAYSALELLITDDYYKARELAGHLDVLNGKRKREQDRVFKKVLKIIDENPEINRKPVILAGDEDCNKGVMGIVASKISELYKKPSIIYTLNGGVAEASGRSFGDFSLIKALAHCDELLSSYGGHTNAAGLSFSQDKLNSLRTKLSEYADGTGYSKSENFTDIDFQVYPEELNLELAEKFELLKPFGNGNPQPVFSLKNVVLKEYRKIGSAGRHLKLMFKSENRFFDCISFNTSFYEPLLFLEENYEIAFCVDINTYRGERNLQLRLIDMTFTANSLYDVDILIVRLLIHMIKYEKRINNKTTVAKTAGIFYKKGMPAAAEKLISIPELFKLNRDYTADVFRKLKQFKSGDIVDLRDVFKTAELAKSIAALETLTELGILMYSPAGRYTYRVVNNGSRTKKQLGNSMIYKILSDKEETDGQ